MPDEHGHVHSVMSFMNVLSRDKPLVPKHSFFKNRKHQILHTRPRTHCRVLKYDLYLKTQFTLHSVEATILKL